MTAFRCYVRFVLGSPRLSALRQCRLCARGDIQQAVSGSIAATRTSVIRTIDLFLLAAAAGGLTSALGREGAARDGAASARQRHARDLGADSDEAILQLRILGLRIRRHALQVVEVLTRHLRLRIIAGGEPGLREMRLVHIVGSTGSAHLGRHPARLHSFDSTSGQRRDTAKASIASWSLLSA